MRKRGTGPSIVTVFTSRVIAHNRRVPLPVSISEEEVEVLSHLVSSGISLHGKVKSVVSSVDLLSFIASELPLHYLSSCPCSSYPTYDSLWCSFIWVGVVIYWSGFLAHHLHSLANTYTCSWTIKALDCKRVLNVNWLRTGGGRHLLQSSRSSCCY